MSRHIKQAELASRREESDAQVRTTVEGIIAYVAKRGDAAVRELSERFDKWSPPSFRLSAEEIAALVGCSLPTAHRRYHTGLAQLRERLEGQWTRTPTT